MTPQRTHKGWHHRGYLPHLDSPGKIQALIFRLADAVPAETIARWRYELGLADRAPEPLPADWAQRQAQLRRSIAQHEDAGHGSCLLADAPVAELMEHALHHFHGQRYALVAWCVMPNHVHVLIQTQPEHLLGEIVQSWKRHVARKANVLLGLTGTTFGAADYYDRYIRDEAHYVHSLAYIHNNPCRAHLCALPADWPWSSARYL